MKRFISVCLTIMLLLAYSSVAFAVEAPPVDQIASNLTGDSGEWFNPLRSSGFAINYTSYSFQKSSSTSIFAAGRTETNQTADSVRVLITVQQWKNNCWNNYSATSNRAYDSTVCSHSKTITVASGYYYRIRVTHSATLDGTVVSTRSYSKSVMVN